ncbi:MAG TPA: ABC transporter substrate-binding protein [Bdellovibrionota bacterium]|nr:ABC transporter substrate-binding protein [Bdellovibrionota bacterium]
MLAPLAIALWSTLGFAAGQPLTFGLPNSIGTFSIFERTMAQTRYLLGLVYDPLVRFNASQELEPAIARAWRVDQPGGTITFEIAPNRFFSDGTRVTAQEVVKSLVRSCAPESDSRKDFTSILGCGTRAPSMRAIGTEKLVIGFKGPASLLLYQLSGMRAGIALAKSGFKLGSGPYQVDSLSDTAIQLSPNPSRPGSAGPSLVLKRVGEERLSKVIQEEKLDGTIMFRYSAIAAAPEGYRAIDDQANITMALVPNIQRAPFNDVEFRRALMASLAENKAFVACHPEVRPAFGIVPVGIGGSIAHLPRAGAAGHAALEHLRKRHAGQTVTLQRHVGRRDACEEAVLARTFAELGVNLKIQYHESYDTLLPRYLNHDLDGFLELYIFPNREAFPVFTKFALSGDNLANLESPVIERAIGAIWGAKTSSERYQAYRTVAQKIQDDSILFPLYYLRHRNVLSKCFESIPPEFAFNPFLGLTKLSRKQDCK